MATWLTRAALHTPRRRLAFALAVLFVAVLHWCLGSGLDAMRADWNASSAMPERKQVAFVREMALSAPRQPGAVAAVKRRAAHKAAAASEPASAPQRLAQALGLDAVADTRDEAEAPQASASASAGADQQGPETEAAASAVAARVASDAVAASAVPLAASSPSEAPFEWPASTQLAYVLTGNYRGEIHGHAQVEWIRQGTQYQVNLDVMVGPKFMPLISRRMTSDGELGEQGLRPLRYDEDTKVLFRERRRVSVLFRDSGVVLANGRFVEVAAGVQDSASQFVQLTWLFLAQRELLAPGRMIAMPLALPRKLHRWVYEVMGEETLDTPMGALPAWRLKPRQEAGGGDLTAEVWIAPQLQYLPVRLRIHQDAQNFVDLMLQAPPLQAAP
jgi:hypothetical protein